MRFGSREEQARYFRGLSPFALAQLCAGVFFSISVVGVYVSLISFADGPWWITPFWGAFTGAFSLLYFFAAVRSFKLLPFLIALQIAATLLASRLITAQSITTTPAGRTTLLQATLMLTCSLLGYAIFFTFIKSSGIEQVRIQTELALAHRLQHTLVPSISLQTPDLEIFGCTVPSEKVGGDLIDCIETGGGTYIYAVDVSGHGIPAGVLMGMIKAVIRAEVQRNADLASTLAAMNAVLPGVKEPSMYATIACLRFLPGSRRVEYALAGHHPILYYSQADNEVRHLAIGGPPVGILPKAQFTAEPVDFNTGDLFVLFTDGCIESTNRAGEEFGLHRLEYAVVHGADDPLPVLHQTMLDEISRFGPQEDDRTLLLIRAR